MYKSNNFDFASNGRPAPYSCRCLCLCFSHRALIGICSSNSGADWGSSAGLCLIFMQLVAIGAHALYYMMLRNRVGWNEERNLYKWTGRVSATLGTIAVFLSASDSESINTNTLVLLITLSVTIQTVGYSLDKVEDNVDEAKVVLSLPGQKFGYKSEASYVELVQWASAAAGQGADFYVVYSTVYGRDDWGQTEKDWHFLPYVLGWSSFGILNLVVLLKFRPDQGENNETIELLYSIFSILAKAFVWFDRVLSRLMPAGVAAAVPAFFTKYDGSKVFFDEVGLTCGCGCSALTTRSF